MIKLCSQHRQKETTKYLSFARTYFIHLSALWHFLQVKCGSVLRCLLSKASCWSTVAWIVLDLYVALDKSICQMNKCKGKYNLFLLSWSGQKINSLLWKHVLSKGCGVPALPVQTFLPQQFNTAKYYSIIIQYTKYYRKPSGKLMLLVIIHKKVSQMTVTRRGGV